MAFYRRISDTVNEIFLKIEDLQGIFVGGPGPSKDKFVKDESLDYRLRDKIMDVVDIGYGGTEGIRALIEKVKEQMENVKYIREKEAMQRFMKEISNETGLAIYGFEEIERALNYGAVDILLLSEKLDRKKIILGCSNCDHNESKVLNERSIKKFEEDTQDTSCPNCSSNSFKIIQIKSLIEELGEIAESIGTHIEIISTETEEGESLYSTFGGIAAILRYKIDY
jgi:peptide chain release factor subunit 1